MRCSNCSNEIENPKWNSRYCGNAECIKEVRTTYGRKWIKKRRAEIKATMFQGKPVLVDNCPECGEEYYPGAQPFQLMCDYCYHGKFGPRWAENLSGTGGKYCL